MSNKCDTCIYSKNTEYTTPCNYCTESDAVQTILKYYKKESQLIKILLLRINISLDILLEKQKNCYEENK